MRIRFDTVTDSDGILRTTHENRPDFTLHEDGTVDLHTANIDVVIGGFGENGERLK